MQNVIINFTADPSGLQPGIDGLVQMEVVDKELASQIKKTGQEMSKRDKEMSAGVSKSASQVEKLSTSFKGLSKNIVGGAYDKGLKQLQKEIESTSDEFKQLAIVVKAAKAQQDQLKPDSAEWRELQEQIAMAEIVLREFGEETEATQGKTQTMKSRLRELKTELQNLEDAGDEGSATFQELAVEAAKLEDQIGDTNERIRAMASDTANIDAVVEGIGLMSSAFQAGMASQALFGEESEDVQKALLKLNAIMAITQSIQQVQNFLRGQSILRLKAEAVGNTILAASTRLTGAAYSTLGLQVTATSTAFKVLRAAIITTGIGAVVVGVGFLISKINDWTSASSRAAEEQKHLAEATKELNNAIVEQSNIYAGFLTLDKDILSSRLAVLQASNGSQVEQLKLRKQIADEDKKIGEQTLASLGLTATGVELLGSKHDALVNRLRVSNEQALKDDTDRAKKVRANINERIQAEIDAIKPLLDAGRQAVLKMQDAETEAATIVAQTQTYLFEQGLKSATAYAEARVLLAKEGSKEELNARINAIQVGLREDLANVNLTAGERQKAQATAEKQIADLRFEYQKRALEDAKAGIDAQVLQAKEGSKQELDFRLQALSAARDIELKDQAITNNRRLQIEAQYQKDREALIKAFDQKAAEDAINARIAELRATTAGAELAADAATNAQLLANKQRLVDEEAALEVISINASEKNEELRRQKIAAVYAKALADKQKLEQDKIQAEINAGLAEATSVNDRQIALQNLILQNERSTAAQRREAQEELFKYQEANIAAQELANQQNYDNGLITFDAFLQKKRELQTAHDQLNLQQEQAHQQRKAQIQQLAQNVSIQLTNQLFAIASRNYEREEERVKALYDQKKISETEYNNQLKVIKAKQDRDAKAQALFTMLIQQGPMIAKGFQEGGIAGAAAAFGLFFSLLGALSGAEPPAYKDGEIRIQGPGTDTSDSILARLSRNESVIKASQSKKHEAALRAINEDRFDQYLVKHEMTRFYSNMTDVPEHAPAPEMDYEKMAEAFAQKLAENPQYKLSFDENGFNVSVRKGLDTINYINKKMSL